MNGLCETCEGLPTLAVVIVLTSAILHATWNVLLARVPRGMDTTAVGLAIGLVVWAPIALLRWRVEAAAWPFALGSALCELAYFACLNLAYARAPAHASYPVARGLAPVLLLVPAATLGVPTYAWVGVVAISGGVLLTAWGQADRRALLYAVPVAVCIAAYTLLDSYGVRHADPATYLWLTMAPVVAVLLGSRWRRPLRATFRASTMVFGLGVYAAYGLVLVALTMVQPGQVPAIAALRESSILFVLALSWLAASRASPRSHPNIDDIGVSEGPGVPKNHVLGRLEGGGRPTWVGAAGAVLVFGGVAVLALV